MKKGVNKKVIIIFGPPGSGKGTQAELLSEKFDLFHLEMSEIIVRNLNNIGKNDYVIVDGKKYYLMAEKRLRESGKLMSPPLITFWVEKIIKELAAEGKGLVTDGCPRTLFEGKVVLPLFKKLYGEKNLKIIVLKMSENGIIWRNSHRRTCSLMRHPILYSKKTLHLRNCPFDGSKLISRKDDSTKAIKIRLKEYSDRTLPLLEYFKKQGLRVKVINGEQAVEKVFRDILRVLK